ncbi:hypothetical protein MUK42_12852 [Musa troglodytarum]|uniref:Uncharacterized protein n=1 Tax=Musa troglodytarum TaxID=320322 RepID=A0A9E7G3B1_9LILI|nr:hypothetical protein MUK42_12852 [Musa troglodytarum]
MQAFAGRRGTAVGGNQANSLPSSTQWADLSGGLSSPPPIPLAAASASSSGRGHVRRRPATSSGDANASRSSSKSAAKPLARHPPDAESPTT